MRLEHHRSREAGNLQRQTGRLASGCDARRGHLDLDFHAVCPHDSEQRCALLVRRAERGHHVRQLPGDGSAEREGVPRRRAATGSQRLIALRQSGFSAPKASLRDRRRAAGVFNATRGHGALGQQAFGSLLFSMCAFHGGARLSHIRLKRGVVGSCREARLQAGENLTRSSPDRRWKAMPQPPADPRRVRQRWLHRLASDARSRGRGLTSARPPPAPAPLKTRSPTVAPSSRRSPWDPPSFPSRPGRAVSSANTVMVPRSCRSASPGASSNKAH